MLSEEDRVRLLEGRHDLEAIKTATEVTMKPVYLDAIMASREELMDARADLVEKISASARDLSETDTERVRAHGAMEFAIEYYGYYRRKVQSQLLELAPGERLPPEEVRRRERLFERYFSMPRTQIANLATERKLEVLQGVRRMFEVEPDFNGLDGDGKFGDAVDEAEAALRELQRETQEDIIATRALNAARAVFDRVHKAHMMLIESVLAREERLEEARRFIRRRDPAYAARRRARAPVEQEAEAAEVEAEVLSDLDIAPV